MQLLQFTMRIYLRLHISISEAIGCDVTIATIVDAPMRRFL
jgi:hypothetical protein